MFADSNSFFGAENVETAGEIGLVVSNIDFPDLNGLFTANCGFASRPWFILKIDLGAEVIKSLLNMERPLEENLDEAAPNRASGEREEPKPLEIFAPPEALPTPDATPTDPETPAFIIDVV